MILILLISSVIDDGSYMGFKGISILYIKLCLSAMSSSFGMVKFLQLGPCQLIPQNKVGIGMFLITIANFLGLIWKVGTITLALLFYIVIKNPSIGPTQTFFELFWRSFCITLLPSIILVTFKIFNYIESYSK